MVALLVLGTIIACLLVDGILVSYRERKALRVEGVSRDLTPSLVFAQDGGEEINQEKEESPKEVDWVELENNNNDNIKN